MNAWTVQPHPILTPELFMDGAQLKSSQPPSYQAYALQAYALGYRPIEKSSQEDGVPSGDECVLLTIVHHVLHIADTAVMQTLDALQQLRVIPELNKHGVAKMANDVERELKSFERRKEAPSHGNDVKLLTDYYDDADEVLLPKIQTMRFALQRVLLRQNAPHVHLISQVEIARMMASVACNLVDSSTQAAKDIGLGVVENIRYLAPHRLLRAIERLAEHLYKDIPNEANFNNDRDCTMAYAIIKKYLEDSEGVATRIGKISSTHKNR